LASKFVYFHAVYVYDLIIIIIIIIIVNTILAFSDYINEFTSKAFSLSFLIFKGFSSLNSLLLVKVFTTFVRPLLEYNTYLVDT